MGSFFSSSAQIILFSLLSNFPKKINTEYRKFNQGSQIRTQDQKLYSRRPDLKPRTKNFNQGGQIQTPGPKTLVEAARFEPQDQKL
jgi:hypothetical protein